jgi:hypothetical protein
MRAVLCMYAYLHGWPASADPTESDERGKVVAGVDRPSRPGVVVKLTIVIKLVDIFGRWSSHSFHIYACARRS